MILDSKLKEFFLDDGTPNWEKYCVSHNSALMGSLEIRGSLRDVLKHVDFYLCKRGFLTTKGGYDLKDLEGFDVITFNEINN